MGGKRKGASQKVFKYFLGWHSVLCMESADEIQKIYFDDKEAYGGTSKSTVMRRNGLKRLFEEKTTKENTVTDNATIRINREDLFGGLRSEGGVSGYVDVLFGGKSQPINSYIQQKLCDGNPENVSAFRGVTSLLFKSFYIGTSPYIKTMTVLLKRIHRTNNGATQWYNEKSEINGDMNPAHIVREVLTSTNPQWGLNVPNTQIDDTSFKKVADTLYSESMGLSFVWEQETSVSDFITDVCKHINAVLIRDNRTNKYKLKLIRDDYNYDDLRILDYDTVAEVINYDLAEMSDLYNQVVVKYWDRSRLKTGTLTISNNALYDLIGCVNSKTIEYAGCCTYELATRLATRDLQSLSTPLSTIKVKCNRLAFDVQVGDVLRFDLTDEPVSDVAYRVTKLSFDSDNNYIEITAIQDIFGLAKSYIDADNLAQTNVNIATTPRNVLVSSLSYVDAVSFLGEANIPSDEISNSFLISASKQNAETMYYVAENVGADYYEKGSAQFDTHYALPHALSLTDTIITMPKVFDVGETIVLGNERIRLAKEIPTGYEVERGVEDTQVSTHNQDEMMCSMMNCYVHPDSLFVNSTCKFKILTSTLTDTQVLSEVDLRNIKITNRVYAPYPPQNVRINGQYFPATVTLTDVKDTDDVTVIKKTFVLTFSGRNRKLQTNSQVNWFSGDVVDEEGVKYYYSLTKGSTNVVAKTELTAKTATVEIPKSQFGNIDGSKLKVWSERDGTMCIYPYEFTIMIA